MLLNSMGQQYDRIGPIGDGWVSMDSIFFVDASNVLGEKLSQSRTC